MISQGVVFSQFFSEKLAEVHEGKPRTSGWRVMVDPSLTDHSTQSRNVTTMNSGEVIGPWFDTATEALNWAEHRLKKADQKHGADANQLGLSRTMYRDDRTNTVYVVAYDEHGHGAVMWNRAVWVDLLDPSDPPLTPNLPPE